MMHMDRGNKDESPHRKVRSNHDLDFRKWRLLFTSFILLIPAILLIIYWGNTANTLDWKNNTFICGSGLIIIGILIIHIFELINKDIYFLNLIAFIFLFLGGIIYLLAAIGIAVNFSYYTNVNDYNLINQDNPDNKYDVKDGIYWFGLHCLFAFSALVLSIDCLTDLYFKQNMRIIMWSFPLLWTSWFAFGYWLNIQKIN